MFLFFLFPQPTQAAPLLANYYLNQLPHDNSSLDLLAKNNLLIISPEQALTHQTELNYIRRVNSNIIILAYVPSQSYNNMYWPNDPVFKNFYINSGWWLKNGAGGIVSFWPNMPQFNMSADFSNYLVNFCNQRIANLSNIDGLFFDMVSDGISWAGEVDLNNDGAADDKKIADKEWADRVAYFLQLSRTNLNTDYIVINGNSNPKFQPYVNGRMFENFPASWDWGGNWPIIMTYLTRGKAQNVQPKMVIINSGTNNTGNKENYRQMRLGLTSSLLEDNIYYSFDFGDQNHGQIWYYDEYGVKLGTAMGAAASVNNTSKYAADVWRRDYENGLVLVNPTSEKRTVDLGGEYEKIIGTQDKLVNDGAIDSKVEVGARDGLILMKTFQSLIGAVFGNGNFARFYELNGARARNGFFAYAAGAPGSANVYLGDVNNDGAPEKIYAAQEKFEIFNSAGQRWVEDYPFGGDYAYKTNLAVGRLFKSEEARIAVGPAKGGKVKIYNYHGAVVTDDFYPLGTKYNGGISLAIGEVFSGDGGNLVLGVGNGRMGEVLIYGADLKKIKKRFYPFDKKYIGAVKVAVGDIIGDGRAEIAAVGKVNNKWVARVFDNTGKKLSEIFISSTTAASDYSVAVLDVNYDGKMEIVIEG